MPAVAETVQPLDKILPLKEPHTEPIPPLSALVSRRRPTKQEMAIAVLKAMDSYSPQPPQKDSPSIIPPSQSEVWELNSTTEKLPSTPFNRGWIGTSMGIGGGTAAVALVACGPGVAAPQINEPQHAPEAKPTQKETFQDVAKIVAGRADETQKHYLHRSVEAEDDTYNPNPLQTTEDSCMDYLFAYMDRLGIDRAVLRTANAGAIPVLTQRQSFSEYFSVGDTNEIPPDGSIIIKGNHVAIATGKGSTNGGTVIVEATSQNWGTPQGGKPTVEIDNYQDPDFVIIPKKVGPQGDWIKYDDRNSDKPTRPPSNVVPTPVETTGPSPEATIDISELSEKQQGFYYAAKNLFTFFNTRAPYSIPSQDGDQAGSYNVEKANLKLPEGETIEDIIIRLARGETVSFNDPIVYTWTQTFASNLPDRDSTAVSGQILLNDLRMDDKSFTGMIWDEPVTPAESRNGVNYHGYNHFYATIAFSGVQEETSDIHKSSDLQAFFDRVRNATLPPVSPYEDFDMAIYGLLTDQGNYFNPDLAHFRSGAGLRGEPGNYNWINPDFFNFIITNGTSYGDYIQSINP